HLRDGAASSLRRRILATAPLISSAEVKDRRRRTGRMPRRRPLLRYVAARRIHTSALAPSESGVRRTV
ncbi:MAG TPA: hypothetical protein DHW40_11850, partial [Microbacterium sp.]|nr:hypothetical protein [Microbacterium sp.]